jgi:hypothetical protein
MTTLHLSEPAVSKIVEIPNLTLTINDGDPSVVIVEETINLEITISVHQIIIADLGVQGIQGTIGAKGDKGEKGDKGDTGEAGADGVSTLNYTSKTAAYTATSNDDVIDVDASGGAVPITLPAASSKTGKFIYITKTDSTSNAVTAQRAGSDTINGSTSVYLDVQWTSLSLFSTGSAWRIL